MDTEFLPVISRNDYDAFRSILHTDLPGTYDEWFQLHAEHRADLQRKGHVVREIDIYSNEFAGYLAVRGYRANLATLRNFVT